jgi:hypothetical protein
MGWILTAGAAAMSLLLGAALPARAADKDDVAKALIAALVVGAIVHELNDKDDRPRVEPTPQPQPVWQKKKRRDHVPVIPAACAERIRGEWRSGTVYSERCLRDHGVTAKLPRHCAKKVHSWEGRDRFYSERCLREAGFKLQRSRHQ